MHKTAVSTSDGQSEFIVMPLGLYNILATFKRLINFMFADYVNKFVIIYLEDIVVHSETC